MAHQGSVLAVATATQGGQALGWSGNSLSVVNAADFSRSGGSLQFDDHETVYTYTGVVEGEVDGDPDTVLMVSAAPSPITYPDERRVDVWPRTVDMFAEVALPEDRDSALQVEVPHALRPLLAEGVRDESGRESVLIELRGLSWVLVDVLGYDTPNLGAVDAAVEGALTVAGQASADAGQAVIDAAEAADAAGGASGVMYGTSATPPSTRRNGSALQTGDLYYQITVGSSKIAAIRIRSAAGLWVAHQIVADSVLVPSSVGDILLDKGQVYADLKITSPTIETNTATDRGIKVIGDRLVGYGPSGGDPLIDIGGPTGLIKGVRVEGSEIDGGIITGTRIFSGRMVMQYGDLSAAQAGGNRGVTIESNQSNTATEAAKLRFWAHSAIPGDERERLRVTWNKGMQWFDTAGSDPRSIERKNSDLALWTNSADTEGWRLTGTNPVALVHNGGGAGMNQTANAANLYMSSGGLIYRSSSARRFKTDIENLDVDPWKLLDVPLRSFRDKNAGPDSPLILGYIAEEVIDAGLPEFVPLEEDGQPQTVAYERIAMLYAPMIRDLRDRITALEASNG